MPGVHVTVIVAVLSFAEPEIRLTVPNARGVAATMQALIVVELTSIDPVAVAACIGLAEPVTIKIANAKRTYTCLITYILPIQIVSNVIGNQLYKPCVYRRLTNATTSMLPILVILNVNELGVRAIGCPMKLQNYLVPNTIVKTETIHFGLRLDKSLFGYRAISVYYLDFFTATGSRYCLSASDRKT